MNSPHIVFTGGGSGGHSVVAMTLIQYFRSQGISNISYIGSKTGIEKSLCLKNKIPYFAISTGKLRRYFSIENAFDVLKVMLGCLQSFFLLITKLRDSDVVFSTGGFVSVPAAFAGKVLGKKVYLHEQTTRVGLANKIISKLADKVFLTFESSAEFFPKKKSMIVGYPLRSEFETFKLFHDKFGEIDLRNPPKKILFVTGGGNGALIINQLIDKYREKLLKDFIVIHQTGKNFFDEYKSLRSASYIPVGFIGAEFPDLMKSSSLMICRSGAGTVNEIMAVKTNVIFVPLKIAQRNEQYHNAIEALKIVEGKILLEEDIDRVDLMSIIQDLGVEKKPKQIRPSKSSELIYHEVMESIKDN